MEIFYSDNIMGTSLALTVEDSLHCARVLRHRNGDTINVVDGEGTMYECRITNDNPRLVVADIIASHEGWNSHPYHLTMAVCPTKNNDRYEWFVEKATEVGVDRIVPLIGDRSERKVYKTDRARKIVHSAAKQSLKALFPQVEEPVSVKEFIEASVGEADSGDVALKFIACCFEDASHPRTSLSNAVRQALGDTKDSCKADETPRITVLIGPEGDFSEEELHRAIDNGFVSVHLGNSRLRTETAAVVAATQIYSLF